MTTNTEYLADPDLTADEQAVLDADKAARDAESAEAQAAKDAEAKAAADAEAAAAAAKPDPVAEALAAQAAETRALREKLEAQEAAAAAEKAAREAANAPAPRDYAAEREALWQEFEDDDSGLTMAEALKRDREITAAEATAQTEAAVQKMLAEQQASAAAASQAAEDAKWDAAQAKFFADPGNAALVATRIGVAAFREAVNEAAEEGVTDYDQILVKAREKVTGVPAVDTAKAIKEAEFNRNKEANAVAPTTLRDVPNTSNPGDNPGASLDNLDISQLEDALAKMSDADRDRYLANAPGGLQDNPRAA